MLDEKNTYCKIKDCPNSYSIFRVKFPLRKLTKEGRQIILVCVSEKEKREDYDFLECVKFHMAVSEIMNKYSFNDNRVVMLDFKNLKSSFFDNFEVFTLHKHLKTIKVNMNLHGIDTD